MTTNTKNISWLSPDNIPEIKHGHYSDPLLIKDIDGGNVIGFYNSHEDPTQSGFYPTPNFTQPIHVAGYILASSDIIVKCRNCTETVLIRDLVGSIYSPQIPGQSFPCCHYCKHCLHFDFVGFDEEE